jgi:hypothetical protein
MIAVREDVQEAVDALTLSGVTPKLYIGSVAANAVLPYFWLRRGGEAPFEKIPEKYEATINMDIYARSSAEAQRMENAVAFLDDHNPAPYGNAQSIQYFQASKTQLSEGEQREHITVLYRVLYADRRRLVGVGP